MRIAQEKVYLLQHRGDQNPVPQKPLCVHCMRIRVLWVLHPQVAGDRQAPAAGGVEACVQVGEQAVAEAQGVLAGLGGGGPAIQLLQGEHGDRRLRAWSLP